MLVSGRVSISNLLSALKPRSSGALLALARRADAGGAGGTGFPVGENEEQKLGS